jgi:hypothetical protein
MDRITAIDTELAVVVASQTFQPPIFIERASPAAYIEMLQRQAAPPTVKQHADEP